MRICSAPTPFDGIEPGKIQAWLEDECSRALVQSVKGRIAELTDMLCEGINLGGLDPEIGATYRSVRQLHEAYATVLIWLLAAERPRPEAQK